MPLTRDTVPPGLRYLLPWFPVFFAGFAFPLLLTDPALLRLTPSYAVAETWLPFRTWGVMLLVVSAIQVAALFTHRRSWYVTTLGVGAVAMGVWAAVFAWAAWHGQAPWSAPNWPVFVVVTSVSVMVTLESRAR